ncbi:ABC transporter permease [Paludibaculum fermentans]|uniref:ABC transporter permease n=1 Tax=Paludibaculum fermentans TaxID=1473598 RepID=A0A7S7NN16_PALFE|nr:ABC transporter permease [Paludibaculum fermentans]QOY86554.1 ABC transporter permease [Paludibaculum fermentans]
MWERVLEIIRKEFRQTLREPRMRGILIGPPLLQMIIFGFAVNLDVEHVRLGWMDLDKSVESFELRKRFDGNRTFTITAEAGSEQAAQDLLDRGKVQCLVRIPTRFGADVLAGRQAEVQILLDGSNSNTASIISNYANGIIATRNQQLLREQQIKKLVGRTQNGPVLLRIPGIRVERRIWFNEELRSRNYFVPGVVVNIIMLVTLMLTSLSIVREKEIGTMEQIMVTPIRPIELMLGKTIPFAIIGFFDLILVVTIALTIFHVPFRGSFLTLAGASALFLLSTLGAGLFMSTISDTQQQAMMASFFFFQPAFMLSGFTFPIRNMPLPVQWITYLNPLRYFMDIVRGVFLKGSGVSVLWPQMCLLALFGVTILTLSALRFHKRLD